MNFQPFNQTLMFNKEDQFSVDVEVLAESVNMYDSPYEVYCICFPNDKHPKESLARIYKDVFSAYLSNPESLSISQIEAIVTTSKRGMGKLDMDLYVKAAIEGEFQVMLQTEYNLSMDIITSSTIEELSNQKLMAEKLTIVKTEPEKLSDYTVFNNKLIKGS